MLTAAHRRAHEALLPLPAGTDDDDGEHEAKHAVAAVPDGGQHSDVAAVGVTTQAAAPVAYGSMLQGGLQRGGTAPDGSAAVHDDDMLHSLLGIADVVDMGDYSSGY